jgi:hypothetical protein
LSQGVSVAPAKAVIIAVMLGLKRLGRFIHCREASRLLSQAQERSLSAAEWLRLRLHLLACLACQRVEAQMRFLRRAMQLYRD